MVPPQSTLDRLASALAGRYSITGEIGAGGMATVYLAEDVKHRRKVAIKVLHPELTAVLGPERFLKEIELTANLQHPHILPLFDSGAADNLLFYVMPFVEGETLRQKLVREQQLPIAEAVRIASDVADALDYAHKRGVVHRDVKPENILLHDGRPLVADFGIALAVQHAGGTRMTQTGMSLGTPQYMAPEQAMGDKSVDHRADVYALGAVTYEMLAGEPPFTGPNSQAVVAKVLTTDPISLAVKRRSVPQHVEDAVLTALEKMPADRFASAAEFAAALGGGAAAAIPTARAATARGRSASTALTAGRGVSRPVLATGAALLLLAAAATGWMLRPLSKRSEQTAPVRFAFLLGAPGMTTLDMAISPDGRRVIQSVYDSSSGVNRIVMRDLGSTELRVIAGTEGASYPTFSHDGEWISFGIGEASKLRKVPVGGGPPTDMADSGSTHAWLPDGDIVYSLPDRGIWRVSSTGGVPAQLTSLDTARREFQHLYPEGLPGNKGIIYTSYATPISRARIEAYEFASRKKKVLVEGAVFGRYSSTGHLLYVRGGAIFAVPFDPDALEVRGTAVPVQDDVAWEPTSGTGGFALSKAGTLAYIRASQWDLDRRIAWVSRSGSETQAIPREGKFAEPRLSPDGRWIALTVTSPKRDVWLYEIARGLLTRLTRADAAAFNPMWLPDSRSILYTHEDPVYDVHRIPIDGSTPNQPVISSPFDKMISSVSRDGALLAFTENRSGFSVHLAPLDGSAQPRRITPATAQQQRASISPSGRWIALEESTQGRANVYLVAADGSGGRRQISVDGGAQPRWTRNGTEIIYRRGDSMLAAPVDPATGEIGRPVELFRKPMFMLDWAGFGYDVTGDGQRFLMAVPVTRPELQPMMVVLNWFDELEAKVKR